RHHARPSKVTLSGARPIKDPQKLHFLLRRDLKIKAPPLARQSLRVIDLRPAHRQIQLPRRIQPIVPHQLRLHAPRWNPPQPPASGRVPPAAPPSPPDTPPSSAPCTPSSILHSHRPPP